MTATDHPAAVYPWLAGNLIRNGSDVALGGVALLAGAVAIWDGWGKAFGGDWALLDAAFHPTVVGGLLVIAGVVLLARGVFLGHLAPVRWSLAGFTLVVAAFVGAYVAAWWWGMELLLRFGPPENATLIVLGLVAAIALARRSRVRAATMTLLGLLLASIGLDAITGQLRLTMGLEPLIEGIARPATLLGLVVVADSLVCLISPSLLLASYAWLVDTWRNSALPMIATMVMRVVAALAIAAACYLAFYLNGRIWEIGLVLVLGVFGVACKLFGWNRFVLLLSFAYGDLLEESMRQSMLMSNGDVAVFLRSPISSVLSLLAGGIVAVVVALSVWRAFLQRRVSAPEMR